MRSDGGYRDRRHAGQALAVELAALRDRDDVLVLGLARGGLPVAAEVARGLGAPFDVFLVRKLGTPGHEELAMGAIAAGGVRVLNDEVLARVQVPYELLEATVAREQAELERRNLRYRAGAPPPDLRGKVAVLVDDGLATGATMRAAAMAARALGPARLVVAVPVGAPPTVADLAAMPEVDEVVCLLTPAGFIAVGEWYANFAQTTEDEILSLLGERDDG